MKELDFSVVVPIYNEAGNIALLDKEIKAVLGSLSRKSEIIYINDGSTDSSLLELKNLTSVKIINLNRNYGQATAFDAGFKMARGSIIISLDGDGQNDPSDIPKLLAVLKEGDFDVVAGWRVERRDKVGIRALTVIGRFLRRFFIGDVVHDSGCALRVYKSEAIKSLDIGGEMHRYILALLKWKGFRIGEVVVNDRQRQQGKSKYGYTKAIRGFFDLLYVWFIYKYSERPIHFFGYLSLTSFIFGLIAGVVSLYQKFGIGLSFNRNGWFFLAFFFMLVGAFFFCFGIVLDLLLRLHLNNSPYEKRYYIREIIET